MAVVRARKDKTPTPVAVDRHSTRAGVDWEEWSVAPLDYGMDCNRFESALSDYFDGMLAPADTALFRAHALQCRACRSLMDDVKAAINACQQQDDLEPSLPLQAALSAIPAEHGTLGCDGFEELITEFLDGFVPAQTYHRFEQHTEECESCSTLLTGVVYAVAGCHSVHTFEEVEVAEPLLARLTAIMPEHTPGLAHRLADRFAAFAGHLIPRTTQSARWTFATAASLAFATFAVLLFGFSDDGTVNGIYRQAHVKVSELYTRGADVYTQTDKAVARLERVGLGIGELWDTLGGETRTDGKDVNHVRKQAPNSNTRIETREKN
jgi:anti-sigma factor RsiW